MGASLLIPAGVPAEAMLYIFQKSFPIHLNLLHYCVKITENKAKQGTDVLWHLLFRCVKVSNGPFCNAAACLPRKRWDNYCLHSSIVMPNAFLSGIFARNVTSNTSKLTVCSLWIRWRWTEAQERKPLVITGPTDSCLGQKLAARRHLKHSRDKHWGKQDVIFLGTRKSFGSKRVMHLWRSCYSD